MDESSLLRLYPDEELKLHDHGSLFLISTLTSPKTLVEVPTQTYVVSLPGNDRNRRDMLTVYRDQDTEVDNRSLPQLDIISVN